MKTYVTLLHEARNDLPKVYLDMDGVLTDFDSHARTILPGGLNFKEWERRANKTGLPEFSMKVSNAILVDAGSR